MVETLWAEIGRSPRFLKGMGHLERRFQREGGIAHQSLLVSETRVIAVSRGINISAVRCLVLSQYTCLTDRRTEFRQQYCALHFMQSHGKKCMKMHQNVPFPTIKFQAQPLPDLTLRGGGNPLSTSHRSTSSASGRRRLGRLGACRLFAMAVQYSKCWLWLLGRFTC